MKCKHVKRFRIHKSGRFLKTFASSIYFCLLELILRRRLVTMSQTHRRSNTNAVDCPHVDGLVRGISARKTKLQCVSDGVSLSSTNVPIELYGGLSSNHNDKTVTRLGGCLQLRLQFRWMKCLESWIKSGVIVSGGTHRIVCRESRVQLMKI